MEIKRGIERFKRSFEKGVEKFFSNKLGIESELQGWLIALIIFAIIVISYMLLTGKLQGAVEAIKNIFRFGGK